MAAPGPPAGEPARIRAAAQALRELADGLTRAAAAVGAPLPTSWRGPAAVEAHRRADELARSMRALAAGLREDALTLDTFAAALARSQQHHHHWMKVLGEIAATVVVTGAVVTATVATGGAAAPAAAAVIISEGESAGIIAAGAAEAGAAGAAGAADAAGTAVAGMTGAAGAAAAAEDSLAAALTSRLLSVARPLSAFLRPQLVGAEVFTGASTALRVGQTGQIDPLAVLEEFGLNVLAGGVIGQVAARAGSVVTAETLRRLGIRGAVARHVVGGAAVGGIGAAEAEARHEGLHPRQLGIAFGEGVAGSVAGDVVSVGETAISRAVNRARARSLPVLDPAHPQLGVVLRADPGQLRFSQKTVRDLAVRRTALSGGWDGAPIDVVLLPGGELVTVDNRRVQVARDLGLQAQVVVHASDEPLPAAMRRRFRGLSGGATWGQAVQSRLAGQAAWWRAQHPAGSLEPPPVIRPGSIDVRGIRPPRPVLLHPAE